MDYCATSVISLMLIYTGGTNSRMDENTTFHSSCEPANWSSAETSCEKTNGTIFGIYDLVTSVGGRVLHDALQKLDEIWIHHNGIEITNTKNGSDCVTIINGYGSFTTTNCGVLRHYVCTFNDSPQSSYVPCVQHQTTPSAFESSTLNLTSLDLVTTNTTAPDISDGDPSQVIIACVVVVMLVSATAVIAAVIIKLRKRTPLHNTSSTNASLTTMSSVSEINSDLQPESPLPMIFYTGLPTAEDAYTTAVEQIRADYYTKLDDLYTGSDQQPLSSSVITSSHLMAAEAQGGGPRPADHHIFTSHIYSSHKYSEIQDGLSDANSSLNCPGAEWDGKAGRRSGNFVSGVYSEIHDDGTEPTIRERRSHYEYLNALHRPSEARSVTQTASGIYDIPNDPGIEVPLRRQAPSGDYAIPYASRDGHNKHIDHPELSVHYSSIRPVTISSLTSCSSETNHYDIPK
ncbi:uncharacterized protein LOC124136831 [Haliotis rufescens]|uniref:uncharacterized protein LOC124136831 n=1 Tax=Haliotis rufescens TaxID=6454 RepID=UPI00201FA9DE|nr:uncharacterized protein LOC124136831 [Haliotis rufescens]